MSRQDVARWTCDWCGARVDTSPETTEKGIKPAKMESNWLVINGFEGNTLLFAAAEQICGKCAVLVHEAKLTRTGRGAA